MLQESDNLREATTLIATVDRLWGGSCRDCQTCYPGQDAVFSIALGFKDAPRCLSCLANGLKRDRHELQQQLLDYIRRRDCYRQAWEYATRREQCAATAGTSNHQPSIDRLSPESPKMPVFQRDFVEWDAGDMSCGDLVLALRIRLLNMRPGSVMKVIAHDPAAPEDLPSWCRLTGHALIDYKHPVYFIRRKEN